MEIYETVKHIREELESKFKDIDIDEYLNKIDVEKLAEYVRKELREKNNNIIGLK